MSDYSVRPQRARGAPDCLGRRILTGTPPLCGRDWVLDGIRVSLRAVPPMGQRVAVEFPDAVVVFMEIVDGRVEQAATIPQGRAR